MKKNNKKKSLNDLTKEQLIKTVRILEHEFDSLNRAHQKAIRYCASLRFALKVEFQSKVSNEFWNSVVDDIETGLQESVPPKKDKKILEGYS